MISAKNPVLRLKVMGKKSLLVITLLSLRMVIPVFGEENMSLEKTLNNLGAEEFASRKQAELDLLALSQTNLPEVVRALHRLGESEDDPQVRLASRSIIQNIYNNRELLFMDLGASWSWYVEIGKNGEIQSFPHLKGIKDGSPAQKAGFDTGNIIRLVNGEPLDGHRSLIVFQQKLNSAAPGSEITFTISSSRHKLEERKEITFLLPSEKLGKRKLEEGAYEKWLNQLIHEPGDVSPE